MNSSDCLKIHDIALANTLAPDLQYYYRQVCRWYSEKFSTPLDKVFDLSPELVLLNYYEAQMTQMDPEDLDHLMWRAMNPDVDEDEEEDIQDFIKMVEAEEAAKAAKKSKPESLGHTGPVGVSRTYDDLPPPEADSDSNGLDALDSRTPETPGDDN